MYLIDTHAHLYAEEFNTDSAEMLQRCREAGVLKILLPNIDSQSISVLHQLSINYPGQCYAMMGLHPCSVSKDYKAELDLIKATLFSGFPYVAVGEVGIDLYWDQTLQQEQEDVFIIQCTWANELQLPIAIHTRNAHDETISCLRRLPAQPGGVFHCFGGTYKEAMEIIELGYSLGIGGVVTYKNSKLPGVLKQIDLKHILLETDSPYLPPVPYRGKRNESSYLPFIAEKLGEIYGMTIDEIAETTSKNAEKLFRLTNTN